MTRRIDRTGHQYGGVSVVGIDPLNRRRWVIRYDCCGKEQSITAERCNYLAYAPPERCRWCDAEAKRIQASLAAPEPEPEDVDLRGGVRAAGAWWPVLKQPFGRLHQSGHETVDPGWRAQRGNAQ